MNASVPSRDEQHQNPFVPGAARKNLALNPALPPAHSPVASRIHKAATNKCGRVFRAPHQLREIDLAPSAPRSNESWRMRKVRLAPFPLSQSVRSRPEARYNSSQARPKSKPRITPYRVSKK